MDDPKKYFRLFVFVFILTLQTNQSKGWSFNPWKESPKFNSRENLELAGDINSQFAIEVPKSKRGAELTENAKRKMVLSNSCWQKAYQNLFSACRESLADEEKRSRFAWDLTDCFQKDSGRPHLRCDKSSTMMKCRADLDKDTHKIFLEFYLEANAICHQLQSDAFNRHTERLVNDLKTSAQFAEDKLDDIEKKANDLLDDTHQIHDSLDSINEQTKHLADLAQSVVDQVNLTLKHSEKVYEQSKGIAASQIELQQSQTTMRSNIEATMGSVEESQREVGREISKLKNQAVEIEHEISKVGEVMFSRMGTLQDKADDIGNKAGASLEKQNQLLDGQNLAFEGLKALTQFQSQALEESRGSLQQLAELGSQQQQELLSKQEELQRTHDRLVKSSQTILAAQENFESKQASMFVVLDKLFALHNAMLLESRGLKALLLYSLSIFVLYMLTSTKQTYAVRPRLYIGLCAAFLIEFGMIRFSTVSIEQHASITSFIRLLMVILSSGQLLYSIYTYRDYEVLNHQMLLKLSERLNEKLNGNGRNEDEPWETDDDVEYSRWIDHEITDDLDSIQDPDYMLPAETVDSSPSSAVTTTKKYNLRQRRYI